MVPVVVHLQWKTPKRHDLGTLLRRAFDAAVGLPAPKVSLIATDSALGSVSAVDRAIRKHPSLAPLRTEVPLPGSPHTVTGIVGAPAVELLLAVADGVPRSLPFNHVGVELAWPELSLKFSDAWWINGRMRGVAATLEIEADPAAKALPPFAPAVQAVLDAFGKPKSVLRSPVTGPAAAVHGVVQRYRAGNRPPAVTGVGAPAGPQKPLLVATFGPRGFDCRGETGAFVLRRRTASNHVVELNLDVGTWSHQFHGMLYVHGPGFRASLPLLAGPIAGPDGWRRIVEEVARRVEELERSFVVEVEAIAGVAPAWFEAPR